MNVASTFKKTQCVATFTMKDWEVSADGLRWIMLAIMHWAVLFCPQELKEVHNIDDDEDGEIPMR